MHAGVLPDEIRSQLRLDLDVECVSPVSDAATTGAGMAEQSWARALPAMPAT